MGIVLLYLTDPRNGNHPPRYQPSSLKTLLLLSTFLLSSAPVVSSLLFGAALRHCTLAEELTLVTRDHMSQCALESYNFIDFDKLLDVSEVDVNASLQSICQFKSCQLHVTALSHAAPPCLLQGRYDVSTVLESRAIACARVPTIDACTLDHYTALYADDFHDLQTACEAQSQVANITHLVTFSLPYDDPEIQWLCDGNDRPACHTLFKTLHEKAPRCLSEYGYVLQREIAHRHRLCRDLVPRCTVASYLRHKHHHDTLATWDKFQPHCGRCRVIDYNGKFDNHALGLKRACEKQSGVVNVMHVAGLDYEDFLVALPSLCPYSTCQAYFQHIRQYATECPKVIMFNEKCGKETTTSLLTN